MFLHFLLIRLFLSMRMSLLAKYGTRFKSCVMNLVLFPSAFNSFNMSSIILLEWRSTCVVGSSSSKRSGSVTNMHANAAHCFPPSLSLWVLLPRRRSTLKAVGRGSHQLDAYHIFPKDSIKAHSSNTQAR